MIKVIFLILILAPASFARASSHPMFLNYFYQSREELDRSARRFDPFAYSWNQVKNHLVHKRESDFTVFTRMSHREIVSFLMWWEHKYILLDADLEAIYAQNMIEDQTYPGKFWHHLNVSMQNRLRVQWFKEHNEAVLPEYRLYLEDRKAAQSSFIHRQ